LFNPRYEQMKPMGFFFFLDSGGSRIISTSSSITPIC